MPSKKHKPEEIIGKLREAEIVLAHGGTTPEPLRLTDGEEPLAGADDAEIDGDIETLPEFLSGDDDDSTVEVNLPVAAE